MGKGYVNGYNDGYFEGTRDSEGALGALEQDYEALLKLQEDDYTEAAKWVARATSFKSERDKLKERVGHQRYELARLNAVVGNSTETPSPYKAKYEKQLHHSEQLAQKLHEKSERIADLESERATDGYELGRIEYQHEASIDYLADKLAHAEETIRAGRLHSEDVDEHADVLESENMVLHRRLTLADDALISTGYFKPDEVGPDVAPRIVELASYYRGRIESLDAQNDMLCDRLDAARKQAEKLAAEYVENPTRVETEDVPDSIWKKIRENALRFQDKEV